MAFICSLYVFNVVSLVLNIAWACLQNEGAIAFLRTYIRFASLCHACISSATGLALHDTDRARWALILWPLGASRFVQSEVLGFSRGFFVIFSGLPRERAIISVSQGRPTRFLGFYVSQTAPVFCVSV